MIKSTAGRNCPAARVSRMYQSSCRFMSWKAVGKPTVRQQRGKWVVRVDGLDMATGAKLPRQLGTFASQRAARNAALAFTADGVVQADRGNVAWAVDRWLASKSDVSAKSRSQYEWAAKHVKASLADAVDDGALRRSPAARVALPKDVAKSGLDREQPAWSEAEVARFVAVADTHRWAPVFGCASSTACGAPSCSRFVGMTSIWRRGRCGSMRV